VQLPGDGKKKVSGEGQERGNLLMKAGEGRAFSSLENCSYEILMREGGGGGKSSSPVEKLTDTSLPFVPFFRFGYNPCLEGGGARRTALDALCRASAALLTGSYKALLCASSVGMLSPGWGKKGSELLERYHRFRIFYRKGEAESE